VRLWELRGLDLRLLALLREHIPIMAPRQLAEAAELPSSVAPAATEPEPAARSGAQLGEAVSSGDQPDRAVPSGDQPDRAVSSGDQPDRVIPREAGRRQPTCPWACLPPPCALTTSASPARASEAGAGLLANRPRSATPLRVSRTGRPEAANLDFTADVIASSVLGDNRRWPLGTVQKAVQVDEPLSVELTGEPLPRGLCRPEATVLIYPTKHAPDSGPLQGGRASGALIQVA
jgi:hypothetical protein